MTQTAPLPPSIQTERDYQDALEALKQRRRPPSILRVMMNALERYRQARKLGWSRPQNKYGLTVFRAFKLAPAHTQPLIEHIFEAATREFSQATRAQAEYLFELRSDPGLMFYVFIHDHVDRAGHHEGVTFSLGRRAPNLPRHRDRFDLIIESPVESGRSLGPSRVRMYIDPFRRPIAEHSPLESSHDPIQSTRVERLFDSAVELYASIPNDDPRVWSHWTQDYIDYFGPRLAPVHGSYFPTEVDRLRAANA